MKKIKLWALMPLVLIGQTTFSQETKSCYDLLMETESYIYGKRKTKKKSRETFNNVRSCAEQGDPEMACMLGILYKDGIGCTLDFDKAREWFQRAHELGSDRATYSMGYLYLKGLGNVEQDYAKAIAWFKKGSDLMAKHWLAKLQFLGYGMPMDRKKGLEKLKANPLFNSKVLALHIDNYVAETDSFPLVHEKSPATDIGTKGAKTVPVQQSIRKEKTVPTSIEGNWVGQLVELEWSGTKVARKLPFKLKVGETQDVFGTVETEIEIGESTSADSGIWKDGTLTINNALVTIEKQYSDHPFDKELDYELLSVQFEKKELGGTTYLIGQLETWITQWAEPGPPMVMVLTEGERELSEEVLNALAQQEKSFIKLYPNPFADDLLIFYDLGKDAHVEVGLFDYYGASRVASIQNGFLEKGEHTHTVSSSGLKAGLYLVQVTVNGTKHSKIVIKK